jgi:hypothetical protein
MRSEEMKGKEAEEGGENRGKMEGLNPFAVM